ncbi:CDGSH iron-sulfur domain-containing protein [Halorubrum sp. SP3]|uniref:CDGSH iron-sulfur domain-containing protein n=1 Tax=Halorubrum sp. SP3 TaxID=1537265 RepID=UPI0010F7B988|nr:CDGSH iron-sulfur domain-containing protein [Halorubrum sp. SP3]TKX54957.1 CDGSH iron-sulfur domain-containing protein [Halorubrum sp. SP3]
MAREVTHEERGPAILDESDAGDDGLIYVCQCGLSDAKPLCDGSHNATADEADGVVYKYSNDDADGERREVGEIDGERRGVNSERREIDGNDDADR